MENKSGAVAYLARKLNLFNSKSCWHDKYIGNNLAFTTQKVILPPASVPLVERCCVQAPFPAEQALLSARPAVGVGQRGDPAGAAGPAQPLPPLPGPAPAPVPGCPCRALCSALRRGKCCWEGWARGKWRDSVESDTVPKAWLLPS